MSFLLELRDAARQSPQGGGLRDAADEISVAMLRLQQCPTQETMRALNVAWIKAERLWANFTMPPDDGGGTRMAT